MHRQRTLTPKDRPSTSRTGQRTARRTGRGGGAPARCPAPCRGTDAAETVARVALRPQIGPQRQVTVAGTARDTLNDAAADQHRRIGGQRCDDGTNRESARALQINRRRYRSEALSQQRHRGDVPEQCDAGHCHDVVMTLDHDISVEAPKTGPPDFRRPICDAAMPQRQGSAGLRRCVLTGRACRRDGPCPSRTTTSQSVARWVSDADLVQRVLRVLLNPRPWQGCQRERVPRREGVQGVLAHGSGDQNGSDAVDGLRFLGTCSGDVNEPSVGQPLVGIEESVPRHRASLTGPMLL
ncbi:hypothetical protein FQR65_LT20698 [Abscondita terminalis]|nr:hypothetical protein FQR65_LT20698 [Abscondita terminalis]